MQKLTMTPVESSSIVAVGYDGSKKELHIQFKGSTYIYSDVNQNLFFMFEQSKSKGKFLRNKIIGQYDGKKQDELTATYLNQHCY